MTSTQPVSPPPYGPKGYDLLHLNDEQRRFYSAIGENRANRKLAKELIVAARTGKAFMVDEGQVLRVECHEDSQVADFDVFNRQNPKEHFSSSGTRAIHGSHLSVGNRLWSHPIYQRPMMTIVADTVDHARRKTGVRVEFSSSGDRDRRPRRGCDGAAVGRASGLDVQADRDMAAAHAAVVLPDLMVGAAFEIAPDAVLAVPLRIGDELVRHVLAAEQALREAAGLAPDQRPAHLLPFPGRFVGLLGRIVDMQQADDRHAGLLLPGPPEWAGQRTSRRGRRTLTHELGGACHEATPRRPFRANCHRAVKTQYSSHYRAPYKNGRL